MWKILFEFKIFGRKIEVARNDNCLIAICFTSYPINCGGTDGVTRYFNNYLGIQLMKKFKIGKEEWWYDGPFYDYFLGYIGIFYAPCK